MTVLLTIIVAIRVLIDLRLVEEPAASLITTALVLQVGNGWALARTVTAATERLSNAAAEAEAAAARRRAEASRRAGLGRLEPLLDSRELRFESGYLVSHLYSLAGAGGGGTKSAPYL